jgi:hypothetical protein
MADREPDNDAAPGGAPGAASEAKPPQATFLQVAGAVLWSFFGVRKGRRMIEDAATIKPAHVIAVGLLLALGFVLGLLALVHFIVSRAS